MIDVHQHMVPGWYARRLRSQGIDAPGGRPLPAWSAAAALELMDRQGIGSDWPFAPEPAVTYFNTWADTWADIDPGGGRELFPRLKEKPHA